MGRGADGRVGGVYTVKKKTRKKQEKRVQKYLDMWTDPLGLGHWHCSVSYYDNSDDYREANGASEGGVMMCYAQWEYQSVHIAVNLPALADMPNRRVEYTVVHELCHALVNEMREPDDNSKHEERVVTMLAKAFRWVRSAAARGELSDDDAHETPRAGRGGG